MSFPEIIQTHAFILLDNGGTEVGEFSIDSDGKPNIKLFDEGKVIWSARGARLQPANDRRCVHNPAAVHGWSDV